MFAQIGNHYVNLDNVSRAEVTTSTTYRSGEVNSIPVIRLYFIYTMDNMPDFVEFEGEQMQQAIDVLQRALR